MREEFESIDEPEEGEDQGAIDDFEANIYDLSGVDEKIANDILKLATANLEKNPTSWSELLRNSVKLIEKHRKGEYEDEEEFTGDLHDKLNEAHDLTPN